MAVKRLRELGVDIDRRIPTKFLLEQIKQTSGIYKHFDAEDPLDVIERFNDSERVANAQSARNIFRMVSVAKPRSDSKFREWKPLPHPRQADIDAIPHQISIGSVGNG
jgi:hypothetical protein